MTYSGYSNLKGESLPHAANPLVFTALSGYRRAAQAVFPLPLLLCQVMINRRSYCFINNKKYLFATGVGVKNELIYV